MSDHQPSRGVVHVILKGTNQDATVTRAALDTTDQYMYARTDGKILSKGFLVMTATLNRLLPVVQVML
jgi:hypothetical protein